jgi:hypothetical protein
MKCAVDVCRRQASWLVTFRHGTKYAYCGWHAHDRNGRPRWKAQVLARDPQPLRPL